MDNNIKGKVVVITGASSGLGEAAARLLAAQGASVVLAARRTERIEKIKKEIVEKGGKATAVTTDATKINQVQGLIDKAVAEYGKVDVLINNAGVMLLSPLDSGLTEEWDRMIDLNIKGVLYGISAVLPVMKKQRSGQIINVASVAGHRTSPANAVYSGTKFAVRAISEGLRLGFKPYNIRTTVISPGAVLTELPDHISHKESSEGSHKLYKEMGIPADSFARAVAYAISQPDDVDVNEILYRPTKQMF